jgi:hypothetical protein
MNEAPQDSRMPRGVLAVVAVGLIATIAAALLATGKGDGEAAHLEFVQIGKVPDSSSVPVPGGRGTMQLTEGRIQATGTNFSGYSLFRVATTLKISKGAPIGGGRILCATQVKDPTEIARSSEGLRALYPRSSEEGIWGQGVPETLLLQFSSHGGELAVIEVADLKQERFTTIKGVKLEWPEYDTGPGQLKYFLPDGKPKVEVELPFYSVWKAKTAPKAKLSCTLETSAGKATTRTDASLPKISPPINEEAEEENAERREEVEEEEAEN